MIHVIATPRLELRPVLTSDAAELHALFGHEDVRRYLTDGVARSREWVEGIILDSAVSFADRDLGLWVAREHGKQAIVGITGFRDFYEPPVLEVFYALDPSFWHRGLATEMASAVIDYAFEKGRLETVRASTDEPNLSSLRVIERLGMRPHGRTAKAEARDVCWDQLHFIVSREEWRASAVRTLR